VLKDCLLYHFLYVKRRTQKPQRQQFLWYVWFTFLHASLLKLPCLRHTLGDKIQLSFARKSMKYTTTYKHSSAIRGIKNTKSSLRLYSSGEKLSFLYINYISLPITLLELDKYKQIHKITS
jgi:hypothetical protein